MIVDSSAMVAILASEPERDIFFLRFMAVGPNAASLLEDFLTAGEVEIVPFSPAQSRLAFQAYRRFGKGMGHRAQLNILDRRTYGLAADSQEPLLFKGRDFDKTDLNLAMLES